VVDAENNEPLIGTTVQIKGTDRRTAANIDGDFSIYCDKTTNMAYLFYIAGHRSAITAYLNADGNPARCNEVRR
jgi:hypothetical protein